MRKHFGPAGGVIAVFGGLFATGLFGTGAVAAERQYTFVNLVDSTTTPFVQFNTPALNATGTVAFFAVTAAGSTGVYRTDGQTLTPIALQGPGKFSALIDPGINAAGTVVFRGDDASGEGIYTSDGGALTRIAHTSQGFLGMSSHSINDAGVVALIAERPGFRNSGIYTGNGGPLTIVADTPSQFSLILSLPWINNAETVAFRADPAAGGEGIYTGNGGPLSTAIFDPGAGPAGSGNGFNFPRINSAGTVAVLRVTPSMMAILSGNGGPVTTVVDTTGPFQFISDPAINDAGTIAFRASLDAGGEGVFTGPDPLADRVIGTGDPLFGSTFQGLNRDVSVGINNGGEIAFTYSLANGVQGIVLAIPNVPEPTGAAMLAMQGLAAAAFAMGSRRRRAVSPRPRTAPLRLGVFVCAASSRKGLRRRPVSPPPAH